jgi:hypothetical protein
MDQIVKALGLINSFRVDGLHGVCNPTSGARLNLSGGLESLELTAEDGKASGVSITSQGFGIGNLSLPSSQDRSIALDPFLSHLQVDLHKELFARLAKFAKEPLLAQMDSVINRVVVRRLHTAVRMTSEKVVHADVEMDQVFLQQNNEELIRIRDLSLSILDFDTKLPPKQAQAGCLVVIRSLRVEIEESFFAKVLKVAESKLPSFIRDPVVELPGPEMVVGATVKKGPLSPNLRFNLKLETHSNLFGIDIRAIKKIPSIFRNPLLNWLSTVAEKKGRGLIEISNELIRINPWSKVPVEVRTHVSEFKVGDGKIVVVFTEPKIGTVPPKADEYVLSALREPQPGDIEEVLAPGPAL